MVQAIKQNTGKLGVDGQPVTVANSGGSAGESAWDSVTVVATGAGSTSSATYRALNPLFAGHLATRLRTSNPVVTADRARIWWVFDACDSVSVRFAFRVEVDPGGAFTIAQFINAGTFSGAASLRVTTVSGQRRLQLADAVGTLLKDFGVMTFGTGVEHWRVADMSGTKGASTTTGALRCRIYNSSLAVVDTYEATNVNAGTEQFARLAWGGAGGVLQDLDIVDAKLISEFAGYVGLPTANVTPTAVVTNRPAPQVAGQVTVTGTVSDTDGTVIAANVAILSGPNNPTVGVTTAGLNTASCTVTGTFSALPGRYVVAVSGNDNTGAASNVAQQIIDVYPPDGQDVTPEAVLASTFTTVGAVSAIEALIDPSSANYRESPPSPAGDSETLRWNPIGGKVEFEVSTYQAPSSPTIGVVFVVYREDGTTVVETFASRSAPAAEAPLLFTLSPANQTALANPIDKRALVTKYTATQ